MDSLLTSNFNIGDEVKYIGWDYTCIGITGKIVGIDARGYLGYVCYNEGYKARWLPLYQLQLISHKIEPLPLPG